MKRSLRTQFATSCLESSRRSRSLRNDESGDSLIEFAVSISVLLMMVFGIMGFSLALYADHFVALAAPEAARYAAVRGSTWYSACTSATAISCIATAASVQSYVTSITPGGVKAANTTVLTSWPGVTPAGGACYASAGNNSPGCTVKVTVTYSFKFLLPFLPTGTRTFSSSSSLPISQ